MQQMIYGFSRGFFTQFFLDNIENVRYSRSGNISGEPLSFSKFKDYPRIDGKSGIIKNYLQSNIGV
jgi:hypothetical protein